MAKTIGSIAVSILARVERFTKPVRKAREESKKFERQLKDTTKMVQRFGTALGVTATTGGIALFIRGQLRMIDNAAKMADRLGTTTEALSELRFVAKESAGVMANQLDIALQRMTRRVSEAASGMGEAQDALRELGLDARQLETLQADQQFKEIADAMQNVRSQADRVRLSFKLFDSEGVGLVNTLRLGREGIERLQDDARNLGVTIDNQAARSVEKLNDQLARLKELAGGFGRGILIDVTPATLEAITGLQIAVRGLRGEGEQPQERRRGQAASMGRTAAFIAGLQGRIAQGVLTAPGTAMDLVGGRVPFGQNIRRSVEQGPFQLPGTGIRGPIPSPNPFARQGPIGRSVDRFFSDRRFTRTPSPLAPGDPRRAFRGPLSDAQVQQAEMRRRQQEFADSLREGFTAAIDIAKQFRQRFPAVIGQVDEDIRRRGVRRVQQLQQLGQGSQALGGAIGRGVSSLFPVLPSLGRALLQRRQDAAPTQTTSPGQNRVLFKNTQEAFRAIARSRTQDQRTEIAKKQLTEQKKGNTILERMSESLAGIGTFSFAGDS